MTYGDFPLSALLSKVLVAFTIEFDNEFEHRMPLRMALLHSEGHPERGDWMSSQVMWSNFMQFVSEDGRSASQIEGLARTTRLPLTGMTRWGYVTLESDPASGGKKLPGPQWIVRPTRAGRVAQDVWRSLGEIIENRWRARFGSQEIDALQSGIAAVLEQTKDILPDYLPLVSYGLWSKELVTKSALPRETESVTDLSLLLARLLLVFATEFESDSSLALAICANCLRVLGESGTLVRNIPLLAGISKEACAVSVGYLEQEGYATVEPDPVISRTKAVYLNRKGVEAQQASIARILAVENHWSERFGEDTISRLRGALEHILVAKIQERPCLAEGLALHRDGWRFSKAYIARTIELLRDPAAALPQFPIVSHRGGYPDGS